MRSKDVFDANRSISNRFMLCQVVAASTRRLQIGSRHYSEVISQSLRLIAEGEQEKAGQDGSGDVLLPEEYPKAA